MTDIYSDLLKFEVNVGTDKNYFIQSKNGAFHILLGNSPYSRCIISSPSGNSGCLITFEGNSLPLLSKSPEISGREELNFSINFDKPEIINLAALGSVRVLREHTEGAGIENIYNNMKNILGKLTPSSIEYKNLENWMTPKWEFSNDYKTVHIKLKSLNNKDIYEIYLRSTTGQFEILEEIAPTIGVNTRLQLSKGEILITYRSSFKPLTPFPVKELLNEKALKVLDNLSDKEKENAVLNLNALRFLAYKEKFLAGSWRFLTYFGRDTLLSLRMLAPVVTPEAIEAEFRGISEHLNNIGEIAHEEDLGDQAAIDQINSWLKGNTESPLVIEDKMISDFISVDTNYLAIPLLLDYYYVGGKKLFSPSNSMFIPILRNINFVISEASELKPVEIHKGIHVGDWRDSQSGLAYGRYAFSVNGAMIPAAILSLEKLISLNVWNKTDLLTTAQNNNFEALKTILEKPEKLAELKEFWMKMWEKFLVKDIEALKNTPYQNGILSLSLDKNLKPIPIIQSDTIFMLLDFPASSKNNWFNPAYDSLKTEFPNGLMSNAGMLVASPVFAPEKYKEMFDHNHYHGQVIWAWQNLMLKIALQKQLSLWAIPAPGNSELNSEQKSEIEKLLKRIDGIINNLKEWSTSELWSWKLDNNGQVIPAAYGQESDNDTESNAVQLWSAAALGSQLWDKMN